MQNFYDALVGNTWSWGLYTNRTFSKIINHIVIYINMWVESVLVPNFTYIKKYMYINSVSKFLFNVVQVNLWCVYYVLNWTPKRR